MSATAVVKVTLNVELEQPWCNEATVNQILKQAKTEANNIVANMIREKHGISLDRPPKVTIIYQEDK